MSTTSSEVSSESWVGMTQVRIGKLVPVRKRHSYHSPISVQMRYQQYGGQSIFKSSQIVTPIAVEKISLMPHGRLYLSLSMVQPKCGAFQLAEKALYIRGEIFTDVVIRHRHA